MAKEASCSQETSVDIIVVGAGFGGLYALHKLRSLGCQIKVLEAGSGVGGTWYWNRYPGARCDVESLEYSYSFSESLQQDWEWPERFSGQAEILTYANHVADRFDLRRDIHFNTKVVSAVYKGPSNQWKITTDTGECFSARFCVMATGNLSLPRVPNFKGLPSFKGQWYHTGQWPKHKVDFTGLRVGVIGTGSSAIQLIPVVAKEAKELTVFPKIRRLIVTLLTSLNRAMPHTVWKPRERPLALQVIRHPPNFPEKQHPKSANKPTKRAGGQEVTSHSSMLIRIY